MYNDSLPELALPPRVDERVRRGSYCGTDVSLFLPVKILADECSTTLEHTSAHNSGLLCR
eukprot:4669-Heterococcus_DN1.PRE.3